MKTICVIVCLSLLATSPLHLFAIQGASSENQELESLEKSNSQTEADDKRWQLGILVALKENPQGKNVIQITRVLTNTPADETDLKTNDIVFAINGERIPDLEAFRRLIRESGGKPVSMSIERDDRLITVVVTPKQITKKTVKYQQRNQYQQRLEELFGPKIESQNDKYENDELRLIRINQANPSLIENLQNPDDVRIDFVDELGVIVVRGPKEDVIRVEAAIKEFLEPKTGKKETVSDEVDPEIARAVTVDDFRTASKSLDLQLNNKVRISFVEKMGIILIQGNREDVIKVEQAINNFIESTKARGPRKKLIRLKNAQSKETAELITQIYEEQFQDREGKVTITPMTYPESLLVVGMPGAIEVVEDLAEAIDVDWIK